MFLRNSFLIAASFAGIFVNLAAAADLVRPLVLWHGLGDSYSSFGMLEFQALIKKTYPTIFIHSIYMNEDLEQDRRAGFYGNVNDQVELAAAQLRNITQLQDGFDAIGLSQGGQFLRAYVERYNSPPVNNLITFGSQHMGISDVPACKRFDFLCQITRRAIKAGIYGDWTQENIVQAQYYRDPLNYGAYLEHNHFLTSINNEIPDQRNETYSSNLASLSHLVLVLFTQDKTVVPKESSWFGSEIIPSPDQFTQVSFTSQKTMIPMRMQPLYKEDWIGLRKLDEGRRVVLEACKGEHMQMNDCWQNIVFPYIGGPM